MKMKHLITLVLLVTLVILITACTRGHIPCDTDVMRCFWI